MNSRLLALGLTGACVVFNCGVHGSEFTKLALTNLPPMAHSSAACADYDNDGLLDFAITGTTNGSSGVLFQLWRNTGGNFTNVPVPEIGGVLYGCIAWADFDNDGNMDFMVTGTTNGILSGNISQLWRNTGTGFTNVTAALAPGLPRVNQSTVTWADFNKDGRRDFLLTGFSPTGVVAQVWANNPGGFTNITATFAPGLAGVDLGAVAAGDFNNDGWIDVLLAGESSTGLVAQIWQNVSGRLTNVTSSLAPGLPGIALGAVAWADYDNDQRLDFIITGESASGRIAQLWRNTGTGFTNVAIPGLPGFRHGAAAWGDYDNDGRLDLLLTGNPSTGGFVSQVWRNTGSTLTNINAGLPGTGSTATTPSLWGDFDSDGRLDLLLTGNSTSGGIVEIWLNNTPVVNSPPPAPANLTAFVSNGVAHFSWSPSVDAQSKSNLTFNLRMGSSPGASDLVSPQADIATGRRRHPAFGNLQLNRSLQVALPPGVYYWSVQAIDSAFAGGEFAAERVLEVRPVIQLAPTPTGATISWNPTGAGWVLQETSDLSSGAWSNSASGALNPVNVSLTNGHMFYRVHKP